MALTETKVEQHWQETILAQVETGSEPRLKTNSQGIVLIPQPSDDPRDPLNWPNWKKNLIVGIISLASFATTLQGVANGAGFVPQAQLYGKTTVEISYSVSAANAGLAIGPLLWSTLAPRLGDSACVFWSMVLGAAADVWSATMIHRDQYVPFVVSRLVAALVASGPLSVGANFIVGLFHLHDRGKFFGIWQTSIIAGTVVAATLSGFIVQTASWTIQFWYNVGLQGLIAILCLIFVDEVGWTRPGGIVYPVLPTNAWKRKMATYFFTQRVTPSRTASEAWYKAALPFLIGLSPVTMMIGISSLIFFAWMITATTMVAVYLQKPRVAGGYGFTPQQNAYFTFAQWISILVTQIYVVAFNDRLPMIICARRGGRWLPEYRLTPMLLPLTILCPVGLGLFGACVQSQWHWGLLAFSTCLLTVGAMSSIGPGVNYIVEAFSLSMANEISSILNLYRLSFSIGAIFMVSSWENMVGAGWAYGTMGLLTLISSLLTLIVLWQGPKLRGYNLVRAEHDRESGHVVEGPAEERLRD